MPTSPIDPAAVLHGTQVRLRLIAEADVAPLAAILEQPEVARWWGRYDLARARADLLDATEMAVYTILLDDPDAPDGIVVGSIQYSEEPAVDYRHAGIDLFVDATRHGQGIGSDAVRTLARHLVHDRGHHRLVIDPQVTNEGAIRCYERVGFRRVGLMRAYERGPDGEWHDCLMLEVLKDELV